MGETMKDFLKKLYRPMLYMILSVYVLSIPIYGSPLYTYARKVLVDNPLVSLFCEHTSALYTQLTEKFRLAILESAAPKENSRN